jgi:hypothetical protein
MSSSVKRRKISTEESASVPKKSKPSAPVVTEKSPSPEPEAAKEKADNAEAEEGQEEAKKTFKDLVIHHLPCALYFNSN